MPGAPTQIILLGPYGPSDVELIVDGTRLLSAMLAMHPRRPSIVAMHESVRYNSQGVGNSIIDVDSGDYHFGRRLAGVLRKYKVQRAIYMGGGSVPLFTQEDFDGVARQISKSTGVTNNLYSSDLIGFPVNDRVIAAIEPLERDNSLARALKNNAGLEVIGLPRTVATQFDIDTPTDVAVLALTREGASVLQNHIASLDLDVERYRAVLPLFLDVTKQIVVAGRVGTQAWSYLERETACRVRLFAEERGMEADGRAAAGAARSLLGYYLDAVGLVRFFATLGELGDAAFIDTRVLLAHKRIDASREDRFLSDLGRWEGIGDEFLREFTRAAVESPMPVLLGGHSLMAGGLMALNEYAWRRAEED
jgi:CTP:molybdopterin cytidylyltransferase MocA